MEGGGEKFFLFRNLDWQEKIFGKLVSCDFSDAGKFGRVLLVLILIVFLPEIVSVFLFCLCLLYRVS